MNEKLIELDKIDPNPFQVRLQEDPAKVEEIARSIAARGLLQTPSARQVDGRYQLAFGHTRLAAYKLLASKQVDADHGPQPFQGFGAMPLIIRELGDMEMFELAVAENVQRRDLNPIETATAMQRYLQQFKKTSDQAGQLFGVSGETVRGTVRLLKLPETIRQQVASGSMTVNVARKFLAAQQVDSAAVTKAQKAIGKMEEPSRETVERELDQALEQSKTAVQMWDDSRGGGEPRGGHDLWPLTWQHNGRLEPLTAKGVLEALGLRKAASGPELERIKDLTATLAAGMAIDPKQYREFTAEALQRLAHLANPPTCITCPFYTRLQGTHYCGVKACWERKAECWTQLDLLHVSKRLDLPLYDAGKDGKKLEVFEDPYGDMSRVWWAAIREKKSPQHAGLRLMLFQEHRYQEYPGTDHVRIVVVNVGTALPKPKRERFSGGSEAREQNRRRQMLKLSEAFVRDVAAPVLGQAFAGLRSIALLQVLAGVKSSELRSMKDGAKRKYLQTTIARKVLQGDLRYVHALPYGGSWDGAWSINSWTRGPVAMAKDLASLAKTWGLQAPSEWSHKAKQMMPKPKSKPKGKAKGKGKR